MSRKLIGALAPLVLVLGLLGWMPAAHAVVDKDCGDFDTQKKAQLFFLDKGGPQSDPHALDADGDGVACESNPCPCLTQKQPPDGGGSGGGTGGNGGGGQTVVQAARVVRVVDGDTVKVRLASGGRRSVRLVGIDTPEMRGPECGARAATRALKRLAPRGTKVRLVSDPTQSNKDRYGRLLRYVVRRSNGRDLNRTQVWNGSARIYVYRNDPFKRVRSYRRALRQAKAADRGIWGSC